MTNPANSPYTQQPAITDTVTEAVTPAPLSWALAGYGAGGRVFHAPLISSAEDLQLTAVLTSNLDRQKLVHQDHPQSGTVDRLAQLSEIGVVGLTITTPSGTHVQLAHEAIDLGLAVVVDKPFALNATDAAELVAHAQAAGTVLVPYQNRRWDSDFLTVAALIQEGSLGRVHRFESRIDRFRAVAPGWSNTGSIADGGGTLLDLGPHLVDQALHLFGPVETVYAELSTLRPGAGAEDDIQLNLRHHSGVLSTLSAGKVTAAGGARFLVNGSAAGFVIHGFDVQESQLKAGDSPAGLGPDWGVEPASAYGSLIDGLTGRSRMIPSKRGRWDTFYPGVAAAIRGTSPAPVLAADAVATARVLDAARVSAAERRVAKVAS